MATLKAKKLNAALAKARKVGRTEMPVTIDGVPFVLQNLSPTDYEEIIAETEGLDDAAFAHAYQVGHVCRSICEIDGVDMREVKYIEDDVPDGAYIINAVVKNANKAAEIKKLLAAANVDATVIEPDAEAGLRTISLERHEWVKQRMASWSREAILVAMKKFAEVIVAGQAKAEEGVTFSIADESYADRFRRLLTEAKALEDRIPPDMISTLLTEVGYLQKSSEEELAAANKRMKEFQAEQAAKAKEETPEEEAEEEAPPPPPVKASPKPQPPPPQPQPQPEEENAQLQASLQQMMQRRQPMNRTVGPVVVPPPTQAVTPPVQARVPSQIANAQRSRSESIAELEAQLDPHLMDEVSQLPTVMSAEVPELAKPQRGLDGAELVRNIEPRPVGGINPRYKPPAR